MKKLLFILLFVGLLFLGFVVFISPSLKPAETPAVPQATALPTPTPEPFPASAAAQPEENALRRVDMDAVRALYAPDAVYALVGEREISWGEYCEWLDCNVRSAEAYMESMAAYGMPVGWSGEYAEGVSFAQYLLDNLNENFRVYCGIDAFAAANGLEVGGEELEEARREEMRSYLGDEASEEDWAALLEQNYLTDGVYRTQQRANLEIRKAFAHFYGENGEKLNEDELRAYIEESGTLRSNHILFLTVDMSTGEALDEETVAAKRAQAEQIAAELQAIEDRDELLARFAELKEELDEDTGKLYYPDGYVFEPGRMVPEFEETTRSLADYQVSDPVLTDYGYHVIIRLPITADTLTDDGSSIGQAAANQAFAAMLDEFVDALDFTLAPGAEPLDLTAFLK